MAEDGKYTPVMYKDGSIIYDGMINVCHTAIGSLEGDTDKCKRGARTMH
jgi:hypothetical protein